MQSFKKFLKTIDLFGQPIQFSFNNSPVQKSTFGGVNTLLLLGLFIAIAFQGFLSIVLRANITSYTTDIYPSQPPDLNVNQKLMNWAVTFQPSTMNIWSGNGQYLKLEVLQGIYTRNINGTVEKKKIKMDLVPCDLGEFNTNAQASLQGMTKNVSEFLCPKPNEEFFIGGKFSSSVFSFINFKISKCQNTTNVTCASDEAINKLFAANGNKIYFNILLMNNIINIYDFDNPLTSFLDDRTYTLINRQSYKEKNFYITKNKIYTDDSIVMTNYKEDRDTFVYENLYDESEVPVASDFTYCSIYLRSNFLAKHHFRTFEKVGRFLSYIGGFWSVLFLFFSILGKKYNKYKLLVKMANELYDFDYDNENKLIQKPQKNTFWLNIFPKKFFNMSPQQVKVTTHQGGLSQLSMSNIGNPQIDNKILTYVQKKSYHKLFENIKYVFKCLFRKSHEIIEYEKQKILREKSFLEIYKEVDIINLLKKLKQVDKIKSLLMNEEQQNLFDFAKKTLISEKTNMRYSTLRFMSKMRSRKESVKIRKLNKVQEIFKELKEYYEAFLILKNDKEESNKKFNEKIINSIDPELIAIFQNTDEHHSIPQIGNFLIKSSKEHAGSNTKKESGSSSNERRVFYPQSKLIKKTFG